MPEPLTPERLAEIRIELEDTLNLLDPDPPTAALLDHIDCLTADLATATRERDDAYAFIAVCTGVEDVANTKNLIRVWLSNLSPAAPSADSE